MADESWVALFSGGKDSSYALHLAMERGLPVDRLLTVHPTGDSYLFHVPATALAGLAAESIGLTLVDVEPADFEAEAAVDASEQGDAELEPLRSALLDLDADLPHGLTGLTVGAVESEFQADRIERLAAELGLDVFAPLWHRDPLTLGHEMLAAGFVIRIVQVAAAGLEASWLGRPLDDVALAELETLHDEYGVHVLGEGGEYETLVTDGPHMARPIELETAVEWDGTRGRLRIHDAKLG
jgi:diphthine-ammonia ligase